MPKRNIPVLAYAAATAIFCAVSALSACHNPDSLKPRVIMDDIHIIGGADPELGLDSYDSDTLMERGAELYNAQKYAVAAKFYERLLRDYPVSPRLPAALFNLGLCYEAMADNERALLLYRRLEKEYPDKADNNLLFRTGACLIGLGRYEEARVVFDRLAVSPDLSDYDKLEVNVNIGVCEYGLKRYDDAEMTLVRAMGAYRGISQKEYIENNYFMAQAQFYMGEIDRAYMEEVTLAFPQEKLEADLERKAKFLLDAQNEYIKTIRIGNLHWAAAAGFRVGALYETFHQQILAAPTPPELDEEQVRVYQEELRKKVSVLISKSIAVYERTLDMAQRVGLSSRWVEDSTSRLEKLKELYIRENLQ